MIIELEDDMQFEGYHYDSGPKKGGNILEILLKLLAKKMNLTKYTFIRTIQVHKYEIKS